MLFCCLLLFISLNGQANRKSNPDPCPQPTNKFETVICGDTGWTPIEPPKTPESFGSNTDEDAHRGSGLGSPTRDDIDNTYPSACVNTPQPSCDVYEKCFAELCNCKNKSNEYFVTYGKKYCQAFLANGELSEVGQKWRENTLKCLQEKILPSLPALPEECDCELTREIAVKTHIECYTQGEISMCSLGSDDISQILKTVEAGDMLGSEGRKTILPILRICFSQLSSPFRNRIKSIFRNAGDLSLDFDIDERKLNHTPLHIEDSRFFKFP